MFFHVLLTTECDLECKYCYGKSCEDIDSNFDFKVDYSLPREMAYDIDMLASFCEKDPECVLSFYGGEPMLCLSKMRRIMDKVKAKHFLIQTNGLHLDELDFKYVNKFHTILVSIDGNEQLTDYNRGLGVYQKIISNTKTIVQNGFHGELIARMTVTEKTDIFEQVLGLLHNRDYNFSSVHWQLDAGFWKNDFPKRQFQEWVQREYNPGIRRLVQFWVDTMKNEGKVIRLYPFLGLMNSLLRNEKTLLRCGSGWTNYTIITGGEIVPCPIMGGMKDFYFGHISTSNPLSLKKVFVSAPCDKCDILSICGGRCLYANLTKRWSAEAYAIVCNTVENIISSVKKQVRVVKKLITEGNISLEDFELMKFNGCEIIP